MPRPKRRWELATSKLEAEGKLCRNCGADWKGGPGVHLERAHIIGREHDYTYPVRGGWRPGVVHPDRIIPLCTTCHRLQHEGQLDVLRLLTRWEQVQAVADAGSIGLALALLLPRRTEQCPDCGSIAPTEYALVDGRAAAPEGCPHLCHTGAAACSTMPAWLHTNPNPKELHP